MTPALSCLLLPTAGLNARLPSVFPSGPQSFCLSPPAAHGLFFSCTPLNLSISPSLPFIFLAPLFGCSLGLSQLLLQ